MFEPVHELATEAGNQRYAVYGALLATGSLIGTAAGDPAFERAARVAVGFDDETFELAYPGWLALHAGLARPSRRRRSRSPARRSSTRAGPSPRSSPWPRRR